MLWRAAVIVIGGGYVVYRVTVWLEIRKARRAGDAERERQLRGLGLRLVRYVAIFLVVLVVLITVLVARNSG
jgi:hypothetical protein